MRLPTVNGPRDLPDLRAWLLGVTSGRGTLRFLDDAPMMHTGLQRAQLWWVEPEACDLAMAAAATYPLDVPLDLLSLPAVDGFAVFAHDWIGTDADPRSGGNQINVSAVLWTLSVLPPTLDDPFPRQGLSFMMFTRFRWSEGIPEHKKLLVEHLEHVLQAQPDADLFTYIGRTDWIDTWPAGRPIADNPHGLDPIALTSMMEDRQMMGTLWLLADTPVTTFHVERPPRYIARRAERAGHDPEVRVLKMRGRSPVATATQPGPGTRQYRHRWVVQPHIVNQPYGPGRSLRKLILRGPFTKGPADAPFVPPKVWRIVSPEHGKEQE